jgi:hypothetical protein
MICTIPPNAAPRNARTITNRGELSGTTQRLRARHLLVVPNWIQRFAHRTTFPISPAATASLKTRQMEFSVAMPRRARVDRRVLHLLREMGRQAGALQEVCSST